MIPRGCPKMTCRRSAPLLIALSVALPFASAPALGAESVRQYGITWSFDKDYSTGQFATGDYWVVGPVTIVGISTDLHASGFTPGEDDDGSMVNPGATIKQGYDGSINTYDPQLNAARPNGRAS